MSLNFVENNKTSIQELNVKVAELISNLNIDLSGKLSVAKCLKINGEVNKAIKSIKSLKKFKAVCVKQNKGKSFSASSTWLSWPTQSISLARITTFLSPS